MIRALIVDRDEIYCGDEAFENGETVQVTASVDNGEGGYIELFSNKLNRPYRVYSGEYKAFDLIK